MMVNDNSTDSRKDMVQLTTHEIMHAYFPFYMGINESKYAWMDEGWATIGESVISPMIGEPEDEGIYMRTGYESIAGTDREAPMITNSQIITATTYFTNSYGKPGIFYWTLQNLLGDELFFKCLHEYMNRWNGKHPTPYDFFFTFNDVSKQDLSWFYKAVVL
jgi:aminopeptidase N